MLASCPSNDGRRSPAGKLPTLGDRWPGLAFRALLRAVEQRTSTPRVPQRRAAPQRDGARARDGLLAVGIALLSSTCQLPEHDTPDDGHHTTRLEFEERVVPIFERRCSTGCHGVAQADYAAFMDNPDNAVGLFWPIDPVTGRMPSDPALRDDLWEVVTGHADDAHGDHGSRLDYDAPAEFSPLLRAPLAFDAGGTVHGSSEVFASTDDPDYQALLTWAQHEIDAAKSSVASSASASTSRAQAYFRDEVIGVLERNGCMLSSCHGTHVFNDLKLARPLPTIDTIDTRRNDRTARFSPRELASLRRAVLGDVARLVNLGGDVEQSRVLLKNIPIRHGGVHHRGGNEQFLDGPDDPDYATLVQWMTLERNELATRLSSAQRPIPTDRLGQLQGVAFLAGPRHTPRRFFDIDTFWPDTGLYVLPTGSDTAVRIAGDESSEVHSFDVRYDAKAIVFAMRRRAEEGFALYQLELDADLRPRPNSLERLSPPATRRDDDALVHHIDPVYIPRRSTIDDPSLDAALDLVDIAYASNEAAGMTASDALGRLGEADTGTPSTIVDYERTERPGTFDNVPVHIVAGPLAGQSRTVVRHDDAGLHLDRPLPAAPDLRTVYVLDTDDPDFRPSFAIWRADPTDFESTRRRVTHSHTQQRRPSLRTTGEIMFTSVRNRGYQMDRPVFNGAIYRVQAGGFDYHIQGGNRSRFPLYMDSRELPSGLEVRQVLDPRNLWGGGALLLVDHGFGVNVEPANPVDHVALGRDDGFASTASLRFLPTQLPIFPDRGPAAVHHTGVSPGGSLRDAVPLPDGSLLVAHTDASLDHLDPDADPDWNLARLRFDHGRVHVDDARSLGTPRLDAIEGAQRPDRAEFMPRPIVVRLKEKSRTHQKFSPLPAGAPLVDERGIWRASDALPGRIECYDFPLLQSFLEQFAPVGERDFAEDRVRHVRIVEQLPLSRDELGHPDEFDGVDDPFATRVGMGAHHRQRIVAEVPLETDGSFYAEVPANVPLLLQALDADKMAYLSTSRWFYVQPGEKLTFSIPRSIFPTRCAGCHGALTGERDDAIGPPDVVSAASRVMATWNPLLARRREPHRQPPTTVDFVRDVQPILDRHCVSCHAGSAPAAGLDLRGDPDGPYTVAYRSLHALRDPAARNFGDKRYVDEREGLSRESHLIEWLVGRELDAPAALPHPGRAHPQGDRLTAAERLTLTRWIDLGATFRGG